jgi:predicted Zn-dependent peptidase
MDATQISAASLRRNFPALLDLIADLARHPAFPAEEIERQRASRLGSLPQQRENSGAVATAAMFAALYGSAHPYGYTELGTEPSNRATTRDDLMRFWTRNFVPNNAALVVSGQITSASTPSKLSAVTAEQAKAASEKYLVPDRLIVVAVGDRAKVGAALQKLNLGAVEVRNADATLAKRPTGTSRDGLGRGDRFLERRHASIELLLVDRLENLAHARTGLHAQLQQMSPEQDGFGRPTLDPE